VVLVVVGHTQVQQVGLEIRLLFLLHRVIMGEIQMVQVPVVVAVQVRLVEQLTLLMVLMAAQVLRQPFQVLL
jgi:hypothetical protein